MENESGSQIVGSAQAPFLNRLADRYSLATDYSALFHPSLPNYIALTSGSNQGITDDRSPPSAGYAVAATNLADRIEAAGLTWKAYGESMPSPGYATDTTLYATRHVPFLYYKDILDDPARLRRHVVPFTDLAADPRSAANNHVADDTRRQRRAPALPLRAAVRPLLAPAHDRGRLGPRAAHRKRRPRGAHRRVPAQVGDSRRTARRYGRAVRRP